MKTGKVFGFLFIQVCFFLSTFANADPLTQISYQGQVASGGELFDGTGYFKFVITNSADNISYWSNDGTSSNGSEPTNGVSLDVTNGLFSVILGDATISNMITIDASIFSAGSDLYLKVWFNDGTLGYEQLSPNEKIVSAAYAVNAQMVKGSGSSDNVIPSSGSVGIGITSPTDTLHVAGPGLFTSGVHVGVDNSNNLISTASSGSGSTALYIGNQRITTENIDSTLSAGNDTDISGSNINIESQLDYVSIINRASSNLTLKTTTSGDILLTPSGDVGVGTTNPGARLHVDSSNGSNSDLLKIESNIDNPEEYVGILFSGSFGNKARIAGLQGDDNQGNGELAFYTTEELNMGECMRINYQGNVGIGKTNPEYDLDVSGDIRLTGALRDSAGSGGAIGQILQSTGTGIDWMNAPSTDDGDWTVSGGNVYSAVGGNVGIGTTSPGSKLDVRGSAVFNEGSGDYDFRIEGNNTSNLFTLDAGNDTVSINTTSDVSHTFKVQAKAGTNGATGKGIYLKTGAGGAEEFAAGSGGPLYLYGGIGGESLESTAGDGGSLYLYAGNGGESFMYDGGDGGNVYISGGNYGPGGRDDGSVGNVILAQTTGNVGIGTSSPGSLLTLLGGDVVVREDDNGYDAVKLSSGNSAGQVYVLYDGGENVLLHGNPSYDSYINAGNVGIGTTSPSYKLQVAGNAYFQDTVYLGDTGTYFNTYGDLIIPSYSSSHNYIQFDSFDTKIYANSDSVEDLVIEADEDILLQPDGQVGIGTTNPTTDLDVSGSGRVTGNFEVGGAITGPASGVVFSDGFESGISGDWTNVSDYTQAAGGHTGSYCCYEYKTSTAGNYDIYVTKTLTYDGEVSFWIKFEQYINGLFDEVYCQFYIDSTLKYSTSADVSSWTKKTYSVTSGTHTFKWRLKLVTGGAFPPEPDELPPEPSTYGRIWFDDVLIMQGDDSALTVAGDLNVSGTLSKGAGSFLIDHPLDPENMILRHSFVESPDMMNLYSGRAELLNGEAMVTLPDYFSALNLAGRCTVHLTPINGWTPLYLNGEIKGNSFMVRTTPEGVQDQEFYYMVSGVRGDSYALTHPIVVEEEKGNGNPYKKGELIHPAKGE